MEEKDEIKDIYENLTEENKQVINMVAQGMTIAQSQNAKKEN